MDIFKINGNFVLELRDQLKWTREKLSEESGAPVGTLQDIENGKSKDPGIENIKKLLKALPNFTQYQKKSELIGEIVLALSALDYDQLRSVAESIDSLPPPSSLDSKATTTD